jgi:hypothetical protein
MLSKNKNFKPNEKYTNLNDITDIKYNPEAYIPKEEIYKAYFTQNEKKIPLNFVKLVIFSYIGGCLMGVFMLALSYMGTGGMHTPTVEESKGKYSNFKELRKNFLNVFNYINIKLDS